MSAVLSLLLQDGLIYLFVFALLFHFAILDLSNLNRNQSKSCLKLGCFILFLFLSLRWKIGCDWDSYYELYKYDINKFNDLKDIYHFDYGYLLENFIAKSICDSYSFLLIVNSLIVFIVLYRILKYESDRPCLSLYLFYCTYFPIHFMGGNRRAVAIVLSLLSIIYFFNKKYMKGFIAIVSGFLFHKSAAIAALSIIVPQKLLSRKYVLLILLISLFLGLSGIVTGLLNTIGCALGLDPVTDMLLFYSGEGQGAEYASEVRSVMSSIIGFVKRCLVLLYVYFAIKRTSLTEKDAFIINLYLLSILIYMAFADAGVLQVMSLYFAIFDIFIFARFYHGYSINYKILLILLFAVYGLFQLINNLSVYPKLYIPYNSILRI